MPSLPFDVNDAALRDGRTVVECPVPEAERQRIKPFLYHLLQFGLLTAPERGAQG